MNKDLLEQRKKVAERNKVETLLICENHIREANGRFKDRCRFDLLEERLAGVNHKKDIILPLAKKGRLVWITHKGLNDALNSYYEVEISWDARSEEICKEILGEVKMKWKTRLLILWKEIL